MVGTVRRSRTKRRRPREARAGPGFWVQADAFVRENPLAVLTILGLLFYGGSLLAYSEFYGTFAVGPDEVGLSYTAALTHVVPAFLIWGFEWLVVFFALLTVIWLLKLFLPSSRGTEEAEAADNGGNAPSGSRTSESTTHSYWRWIQKRRMAEAVIAAAVLIFLFILSALDQSRGLAERVQRGHEVTLNVDSENVGFVIDSIWRNPLRIQVNRTQVWPSTKGAALPANLVKGSTLAYLGRTAETIVLYDSAKKRVVRVPARLVVLTDAG
jgi:hypothetical protein